MRKMRCRCLFACAFYLTLSLLSGMEKDDFRLHSRSVRMEGHPVARTLSGLSLVRCAMECASDRSLLAFNYNPSSMLCELMVKNQQNLSGTLTVNSDFNYYVRFSATLPSCSSNPCLYGSRCLPTDDRLDYRCLDCPAYFGGKNCGDLNCDINKCRQFNDTVYFSVSNGHFWKKASDTCASLGMTLAMPKKRASNEFMVDFLKWVNGQNSKILAWIGLSSNGSEWGWVDGSPLGDFVWGAVNMSEFGDGYGVTFYVYGNVTMWHPKPLNDYGYSFVCERHIYQPPSCLLNPCLYGSRCVPSQSGYSCLDCPPYFHGKHCEKLNCGNVTCFNFNGKLYMVLEGAGSTWTLANSTCAAKGGMRLATLKDQLTNDYVSARLDSSYGRNASLSFWFGLRTMANGGGWQWADGKNYTGSRTDFKTNGVDKCASLRVNSFRQLDFKAESCEGSPDFRYYSLCEKLIFVPKI